MGFASLASENTEQEDTIMQAGMRTKTSFIMTMVVTNLISNIIGQVTANMQILKVKNFVAYI